MSYLTGITFKETGLVIGQPYTLFFIDEFMALSHRIELVITKCLEHQDYAQYKDTILMGFKERGKRKEAGMRLKESMLFLKGWDLGLKLDTDLNSFSGNALLNFIGELEQVKQKIETLNDFKLTKLGYISIASEQDSFVKRMLFPEDAKQESHAVVQQILSKS